MPLPAPRWWGSLRRSLNEHRHPWIEMDTGHPGVIHLGYAGGEEAVHQGSVVAVVHPLVVVHPRPALYVRGEVEVGVSQILDDVDRAGVGPQIAPGSQHEGVDVGAVVYDHVEPACSVG